MNKMKTLKEIKKDFENKFIGFDDDGDEFLETSWHGIPASTPTPSQIWDFFEPYLHTPNSQIQQSNVKIADWATGSDTGASSKALMRYMLGLKPSSWGFFAPSDADDRGRCVRLLNLFPEWLERLDEMAQFICWGEQIPLIKSEFEQYKLERAKDNE